MMPRLENNLINYKKIMLSLIYYLKTHYPQSFNPRQVLKSRMKNKREKAIEITITCLNLEL